MRNLANFWLIQLLCMILPLQFGAVGFVILDPPTVTTRVVLLLCALIYECLSSDYMTSQ